MIVVDSSALAAIMQREPPMLALRARIGREAGSLISAANFVETGQVLAQRNRLGPDAALAELERFLTAARISIAPIDETQARIALEARIKYGRGFGHPARLNYSDCFAYALAKTRNLPLLYVGDDFTHTDIVPALP